MEAFTAILARAAARKGGAAAVEALLPEPATPAALRAIPDSACLAEMTACVFRSGFVWRVVQQKWPAFEAAFDHFDVTSCAMFSDEALEALGRNPEIIRHAKKIRSVRRNAQYVLEVRAEHGGFGAYLAAWPDDDFVGLWDELRRRGDRLGGQTGRYLLRFLGKDTPLLTTDVVGALLAQGIIDRPPASRRALRAVQDAFNDWRRQSGRPHCQISRVLALSV